MLLEKQGVVKDPGLPNPHIQARLQPTSMSRNSSYKKSGKCKLCRVHITRLQSILPFSTLQQGEGSATSFHADRQRRLWHKHLICAWKMRMWNLETRKLPIRLM